MASPRLAYYMFIVLCIYAFAAQAQMHDNAWVRTTFGFSATKRIEIDAELQHRRQNGFSNSNILDKNLMFSTRVWIHYQHKPILRLLVSPFACFRHYKPILIKSDENTGFTEEIRFALAADLRPTITEKIVILYRPSVEYRLPSNYPASIIRIRNRLGLMYRISEKLSALAYDELFINANTSKHQHVFDHNRIAISFEYEVKPKLRLDVGYIYIIRLPLLSSHLLYENNLFLNLTYTLNKI